MDTSLVVRARGITKCFGDVVALDGIDLDVAPGQIHGLVGPNGAGKTTLLGLLLGLAVADSGSLEILGTPVGRALAAPDGVAGFVDGPGLYPSLTARQNLAALAALRGRDARRRASTTCSIRSGSPTSPTTGSAASPSACASGSGSPPRCSPGRGCWCSTSRPTASTRPARTHVHGVLTRLAADGTAVVLSSHRMDDLEALCSEVTILATGRVVFSGPLDKLAAESRRTRLPAAHLRLRRRPPSWPLGTAGLHVVDDAVAGRRATGDALVVRAAVPALDELVVRLVHAGVAVRELAPVVSPLEAAFLALTEQQEDDR